MTYEKTKKEIIPTMGYYDLLLEPDNQYAFTSGNNYFKTNTIQQTYNETPEENREIGKKLKSLIQKRDNFEINEQENQNITKWGEINKNKKIRRKMENYRYYKI